ncbi:MAG TPA: methylenetetrahydrofolate reductase [Acidimicrobiales bacterium]|nr:methylenetetrahydrofolate reductase [Acidimicrobiales bacterium]
MTAIIDLLARGFSLSVELWPPRSSEAQVRLERSLERLVVLNPTFASITYGAAGSTRERTHDLVVAIHESNIMTPMAHLVCAAHRRDELVAILERYKTAGIENVLALRGDPPLDEAECLVEGDLRHAVELVDLAKEIGDFCVAVGAHPEGHPNAPDRESDRRYLAEKLEHADFAITQFFFRVDDYFSLVDDLAERGIRKPVIPGIMPITNVKTVSRMAELSGTQLPDEVLKRIRDVAEDPDAVHRVGVEIATELCAELTAEGIPGLHFYTMNQVSATLEVCERLDLVKRKV